MMVVSGVLVLVSLFRKNRKDTEAKIRHLEMIQRAKEQAVNNSLRMRGIAMLVVSGVLVLLFRENQYSIEVRFLFVDFALLVIGFLGLLDYYFMRQSNLFNILYNRVRTQSESDIDFSMEVAQYSDELDRQLTSFPVIAIAIIYLCIGFGLFLSVFLPA